LGMVQSFGCLELIARLSLGFEHRANKLALVM
jgi:hypothetical protein